jgi:hypothetical protein
VLGDAFLKHVCDAAGDDPCFAGTRARNNKNRPLDRLDSLFLGPVKSVVDVTSCRL